MAEKSIFWTTGATGDGASSYTQAEVIRWMRQLWLGDNTDEGVMKNYLNELAASGATSPVAVNTGAAIVYGFPYWNTVSENVTIPTPAGSTRVDLIVLRADWTAQTVRLTRIAGTEGAGPPSLTQTDGVLWDLPLWQASITTGGAITLTDQRVYVHPNIEVETSMLEDESVTADKIAAAAVGAGLGGGGGFILEVNDDNVTLEISADILRVKDDGVDDAKIGNRVLPLRRRHGGSGTVWTTPGSSDYDPELIHCEAGSVELTILNGNSAGTSATITFDTAFDEAPLVFCNQQKTADTPLFPIALVADVFASTLAITGYSSDNLGADADIRVHWIAIGPE